MSMSAMATQTAKDLRAGYRALGERFFRAAFFVLLTTVLGGWIALLSWLSIKIVSALV